jgi:hypothetical protein
MRGVFAHLPMAGDGQVLVNLGLIHRDNEVIPYWDGWLSGCASRAGGACVVRLGSGARDARRLGRPLRPELRVRFPLQPQSRKPNKIVPCKHAGQESHLRADGSSTAMRGKDGEVGGWTHKGSRRRTPASPTR